MDGITIKNIGGSRIIDVKGDHSMNIIDGKFFIDDKEVDIHGTPLPERFLSRHPEHGKWRGRDEFPALGIVGPDGLVVYSPYCPQIAALRRGVTVEGRAEAEAAAERVRKALKGE